VVTPVLLVMGAAFFIGRKFKPDERTLSIFLIYLFTPSLVFRGMATMKLTGAEIGGIAGVAIGLALIMACIGLLVTRYAGWNRELGGAFIASIIMVNAANYGIPLNTFAFGEAGGERALAYYAVALIPGNILGIFFTSWGSVSVRQAIKNVVTVPITYAAIAGLAVNAGILIPPVPVMRAIVDIAANASIPVMLALLGLKLSQIAVRHRKEIVRPLVMAVALRLVIAPFIALPLALLFGLTGITLKVAIAQSSMPTAVLVNVLASQFGSDTEFTSAVTLVSTLTSILTLSILLTILTGVPG
jgi:malate permease and related proteins